MKGIFSTAKFEDDNREMGVMYALVNKIVQADKVKNSDEHPL